MTTTTSPSSSILWNKKRNQQQQQRNQRDDAATAAAAASACAGGNNKRKRMTTTTNNVNHHDDVGNDVALPGDDTEVAAAANSTCSPLSSSSNKKNTFLPATPPPNQTTGNRNYNDNANATTTTATPPHPNFNTNDDPATWSKAKKKRMKKKEAAAARKKKEASAMMMMMMAAVLPAVANTEDTSHGGSGTTTTRNIIMTSISNNNNNNNNTSPTQQLQSSSSSSDRELFDDSSNHNNNSSSSRRCDISKIIHHGKGNKKSITSPSSDTDKPFWQSPMPTKYNQHHHRNHQLSQNQHHSPKLDDSIDTEEKTVSLDAIKYSILGRTIPSMYDAIHTDDTPPPPQQQQQQQSSYSYSSLSSTAAGAGAATATTTTTTTTMPTISSNGHPSTKITTSAQQQTLLRHELSCPICHNLLYNPVSLLCGHSFCQVCLDWWLDRQLLGQQQGHHQQQQQRGHRRRWNARGRRRNGDNDNDDDVDDDFMDGDIDSDEENGNGVVVHATCPSCRGPIPNNNIFNSQNSDNNNNADIDNNYGPSNKPTIHVNTALKAVLDNLYSIEMNQRRQAEQQQKLKARGGEMGGMHSRGSGVEIVSLPIEEEEDELRYIREMIRHHAATGARATLPNEGKGDRRYDDEDNGWVGLFSLSNQPGWSKHTHNYQHGSGAKIMIRRNIVLDEHDRRYQLSLGLTKCSYSIHCTKRIVGGSAAAAAETVDSRGVLDIELCLLTMEEDEVEDSGFPMFASVGSDDEALIYTSNDRVHSCIQSSMRVVSLSAFDDKKEQSENGREAVNEIEMSSTSQMVRDVPLSRGMIGRDGKVRFRIDVMKVLEGVTTTKDDSNGDDGDVVLVKLKFVHETGAMMEVRLPPRRDIVNMLGGRDGEIVFGVSKRGCASKDRNDPTRYFLDEMDKDEEESDDEPNEYVEDGFLVYGSHDSDEEDCDSRRSKDSYSGECNFDDHEDDDDEDGECRLCLTGGDLIVCDGGNHGGGCGHLYHLHCIGRSVLPPGDWICRKCAREIGLSVGLQGHEYKVEENEATQCKYLLVDDSDEDDDIAPVSRKSKKRIKRKIIDTPESRSDSE